MTNAVHIEPLSRWLRASVSCGVLLVAATVGTGASAQHGPPMGGPGMSGPEMMFGGPPEHTARMLDGMLDGLNASDAQRAQIKQIAQAAAADLKAQGDSGRALRDKAAQLLTAANVDAAAAEQVRLQMLALHDQMSRRTLAAMLDISRVLTPEQRAKLGDRLKQRSDAMRERSLRMERERPRP